MKPLSLNGLRILILTSSALLGLGLCGPSMTVIPQFGKFSALVNLVKPDLVRPQSFSLVEGIWKLLESGVLSNIFVGLVIFIFSVVFPLWKLGMMWGSIEALAAGGCPLKGLYWIEKYGKLSMLDIYVVALIVLAIKGLPGGTTVEVNWGIVAFALSVICTLKVPHWLAEFKSVHGK